MSKKRSRLPIESPRRKPKSLSPRSMKARQLAETFGIPINAVTGAEIPAGFGSLWRRLSRQHRMWLWCAALGAFDVQMREGQLSS